MIIMILCVVIFILALIYCISERWQAPDGIALLVLLGIYLSFFVITAIVPGKTEWNTRYLGLSSRIALWNGGAEDPTLWTEVAEYNEDLADAKRNTKNIWVNWISEKDCLNYEPIEIPEYERKG